MNRSESSTQRRQRVLLVEDDPLVRSCVRRALSSVANVRTAATGTEALAILDGEVFDVVLTDFDLGDIDGGLLLEHARARLPAARRVLLTARDEVERRADPAWQVHLRKPAPISVLRAAVLPAGTDTAASRPRG